ncbi:MAG: DUF2165 domain-containing protein [Pseudomonadales bacterium]
MNRYLKACLVAFVGLMALMYALQNIVNIDAAVGVVGAVLAMADHEYYARSLVPALTNPALAWLGLIVIIASELAAGLLALKGAWDLWSARAADAGTFNRSKTFALLGCGAGVIVWFGYFGAVGGAFFQMWQTDLGAQSLNGAFQNAVYCALVLLFVSLEDV